MSRKFEVEEMDIDFWASRIQSTKSFSTSRLSSSGSLIMDDGEDDVRTWFPCPFCYVEIEVPVLCSHLQEEHCFDLKNAVCPICAASLGKDPVSHFTTQHAQSVKRRRKLQKSGVWNSVSTTIISKDYRDLTAFMSSNSLSNNNQSKNSQEFVSDDPLLSPFLCTSRPISRTNDGCTEENAHHSANVDSTRPSMSDPVQQQEYAEKTNRAVFFQELIISTIF